MAIEITRPGKNSLIIENPVMPASGIFGFGDVYRSQIKLEKLGALVTNSVTYQPWNPASGTRVIPLDAGVLVHTGLPNLGISKVLAKYRPFWDSLPLPVIMHIVATTPEQVGKCASRIETENCIDAIELGLNDDVGWKGAMDFVRAVVERTEKPILAGRL
jgi:dihydroorotate dehydrogenase (NAD+) catalytic subunit